MSLWTCKFVSSSVCEFRCCLVHAFIICFVCDLVNLLVHLFISLCVCELFDLCVCARKFAGCGFCELLDL